MPDDQGLELAKAVAQGGAKGFVPIDALIALHQQKLIEDAGTLYARRTR